MLRMLEDQNDVKIWLRTWHGIGWQKCVHVVAMCNAWPRHKNVYVDRVSCVEYTSWMFNNV